MLPAWPLAGTSASVSGLLRAAPADFRVEELLDVEFSDDGEFQWLFLEKTGLTTEQLARELARFAGVKPDAVTYSGLKDKHAVTRQWFCVHLPGRQLPDWTAMSNPAIRLLASQRHRRKLRRATHHANSFSLRLTALEGDFDALQQRLSEIVLQGIPNYFGEQRFGFNGDNVQAVRRWFAGEGAKPKRFQRGILLSTARAWLFNNYLAERVVLNNWNRYLSGDVLVLRDSNSIFQAREGEDLSDRMLRGDVHPAGPLPGRSGKLNATDEAALLEQKVEASEPLLCEGLAARAVDKHYRSLRVIPRDVEWELQPQENALTLSFSLPAGCFATALVRELMA